MIFSLIPFEGTDSIKLGMTSEEIKTILKKEPKCYENEEYYQDICKVFYEINTSGQQVCAEIEFIEPAQVYFDGVKLLGEPRDKIIEFFKQRFEDYVDAVSNYYSDKYGIGIYVPKAMMPDERDVVQSVSICRSGYKESLLSVLIEQPDVVEEVIDPTMRRRLCPQCMKSVMAKPDDKCPQCNVLML